MSDLVEWLWLSVPFCRVLAFCAGVALLLLMMLSSVALLFHEMIDGAVAGRGRPPISQ